jgi:hypothetical protein
MQPANNLQTINKEGRILLALQAFKRHQFKTLRAAAAAFSVSQDTLRRRRDGKPSRRDTIPPRQNMTPMEESVIIQHIIDLDSRGFSPTPKNVAEMANILRDRRNLAHVGPNWATRFIKRTPELKSRFSRKYDYKRALCEDPKVIQAWFALVHNTITKYGIASDDIYNFDEIGFQMGVASTVKVITAAERRQNPKRVQPGNREWATVIESISAEGQVLPPFIILKGRTHLST